MATAYQHPECYSRVLGGCSQTISREHYFSDGALRSVGGHKLANPSVYGRNLVGQKPGIQKLLDIGRLTGEILCTTHNSALAPYDTGGMAMCDATEALHKAALSSDHAARIFRIDGDAFERWMLKTLCSCLCSGKVWAPLIALKGAPPPVEWLEVLFNKTKITAGQGIYWQPPEIEGLNSQNRDEVEFHPLFSADDLVIIGLRAWFYWFHFELVMTNIPTGAPTTYQPDLYRPGGLGVVGCGTRICFDWADGPKSPGIVLPVSGR